jgi:histidine triad (HIT) family protein
LDLEHFIGNCGLAGGAYNQQLAVPKRIWSAAMGAKSIFKRIIDKEIPARIVYEDDLCLAFHDVNPQAPTHVLLIPKQEVASLDDVDASHQLLLGHLLLVIRELAQQLGLSGGYRVVTNCGNDAGQSVPHLHLHLLGGRSLAWPPG